MRRIILFLILLLLLVPNLSGTNNPRVYSEKAGELFMENQDNVPQCIRVISEGLRYFPFNEHLIYSRAGYNSFLENFSEVRDDALLLIGLKPDSVEHLASICFLDKITGASRQSTDRCFQTMAALYMTKYELEKKFQIEKEFEYVTLLLLGHHPAAEAKKKAFLEKADRAILDRNERGLFKLYKEILEGENFDEILF